MSSIEKIPFQQIALELVERRWSPDELRRHLLKRVLDHVPANGPCSLLQLTSFFSEGGKKIGVIHVRPPNRYRLLLWLKHIIQGNSDIEKRIFARRSNEDFGVSKLADLFTPEEWRKCKLFPVATKCRVNDIAYLWIRCSPRDLWVICIRRTLEDTLFSEIECSILQNFGEMFFALKRFWYDERFHSLTPSEQEVVKLTLSGYSAKAIAKSLKKSKRTVEEQLRTAREKLNAHSTAEIFATLNPLNHMRSPNNPMDRSGGSAAS